MSDFEALRQGALEGDQLALLALADWLDEAGQTAEAEALRGPAPTIDLPLVKNRTMRFAWVPPGEGWLNPAGPTHYFTLEKPLWCGIYPVTQAEWKAVMGNNPSLFAGNPTHPVEKVSMDDVQSFLAKVNQERSGRGHVFRLPTEEEWEYACRGGPLCGATSQRYDFTFARSRTDMTPVRSNDLSSEQANFDGRFPAGEGRVGPYLMRTSPVGSYLPNPLGIYDMHGNVWEWTSSVMQVMGQTRLTVAGGSFLGIGEICSAASRSWEPHWPRASGNIGFRVVVEPA